MRFVSQTGGHSFVFSLRAVQKLSLTSLKRMVKSSGFIDGPVAQLGARVNRTDEVAGSNPARSTK